MQLVAMRSTQESVVVIIQRRVHVADLSPVAAAAADSAAHRVLSQPVVCRLDVGLDAARFVADQYIQLGGYQLFEQIDGLVSTTGFIHPPDGLPLSVYLSADRNAANRPVLGMILPVADRSRPGIWRRAGGKVEIGLRTVPATLVMAIVPIVVASAIAGEIEEVVGAKS